MPYKNAADVRAQHPGVYDDLTDQQIEQGLARNAAPAPVDDGALGERYHPNSADTPDSAFIGELARTGKEAGIGMLRGIPDTVSSLYNTVRHPLDTLVGLGHAVANPTETVMNLAKSPRDAGSLLTQMLLTPKVPGAANTALAEGPSIAGRAISAVGRGAEAAGTSKLAKRGGTYGALTELATGHPGAAAVTALVPPALEYGGKGLQKLGGAMEGLDLSIQENPFKKMFKGGEGPAEPYAPKGTEVPIPGQEMGDAAGSWERSPSDNPLVPGRRNAPVSVRGLEDAAGDNAWAGDKSARSDEGMTRAEYYAKHPKSAPNVDVPLDSRITGLSPIEEFYKNDPQARIGGEGRMTGQFKEGSGGLADVAAGRLARYDAPPGTRPAFTHEGFLKDLQGSVDGAAKPSPLDELSRLSGRGLSPDEIQKLLDRFKGWEPE